MCSRVAILVALLANVAAAQTIPAPQGFVTDTAGAVSAATRTRITRLAEELQQKTGAEIAVLTVETTAPLDDFTYAMKVADSWKPGRKGEDTGVVVLVATKDRKLRIVTGYGVEGALPDGLVGAIQDREMVPAFRAGNLDEGLWRGVAALAAHIAADRGVTLTGMPAPRAPEARAGPPAWLVIVLFIALILILMAMSGGGSPRRLRHGRGRDTFWLPGGYGGGFPGGGWSGGGGGFGGFGGGSFGGGGAGRSW